MKVLNVTSVSRIADENGNATPQFLRVLDILISRTGGIGGDGGSDEFTLQTPAFGEQDALGLELMGAAPPEQPEQPEMPIVTQGTVAGEAWPVGSIFISTVTTNPADLLGYGAWIAFGSGRVLVGLNAADTDFDTLEETGGAKTSTPSAHTGTAVGDHASHTHSFTQSSNAASPDLVAADVTAAGVAASGTTGAPSATLTHSVTQPATHAAMSIVQAFITVQMWKRTS